MWCAFYFNTHANTQSCRPYHQEHTTLVFRLELAKRRKKEEVTKKVAAAATTTIINNHHCSHTSLSYRFGCVFLLLYFCSPSFSLPLSPTLFCMRVCVYGINKIIIMKCINCTFMVPSVKYSVFFFSSALFAVVMVVPFLFLHELMCEWLLLYCGWLVWLIDTCLAHLHPPCANTRTHTHRAHFSLSEVFSRKTRTSHWLVSFFFYFSVISTNVNTKKKKKKKTENNEVGSNCENMW